jgi:hypothetical protein
MSEAGHCLVIKMGITRPGTINRSDRFLHEQAQQTVFGPPELMLGGKMALGQVPEPESDFRLRGKDTETSNELCFALGDQAAIPFARLISQSPIKHSQHTDAIPALSMGHESSAAAQNFVIRVRQDKQGRAIR